MKKLFKLAAFIITPLIAFSTLLLSSPSYAAEEYGNCQNPCAESCHIPDSAKTAHGCDGTTNDNPLATEIVNIVNGIIFAAGIVAVIFIVIGGINYMTSAGDPGKVKKGKDTILYAMIGLVICALSFAIVNWVIRGVIGGERPSGETSQQQSN